MLMSSLVVKTKPETIPSQMHFMIYHGTPNSSFFKVPEKCIIFILSPIGKISKKTEAYKKILGNLNETEYNAIIKNPICYKRNELNGLYSDASVYLPGQYCPDMFLSGEENKSNDGSDYWGLYKKLELNGEPLHIQHFEKTSIQEIITDAELKGIIIIQCCRSIDYLYGMSRIRPESNKNIKPDDFNSFILIKQYETFINIINKCVFFSNPTDSDQLVLNEIEYNNCDKITDFNPKDKYHCYKRIDFHKAYNRRPESIKYVRDHKQILQPKLNNISKNLTQANSSSARLQMRILPTLIEYLQTNSIINKIHVWLCSNNPCFASMKDLFDQLNKIIFTDTFTIDDVDIIMIFFKLNTYTNPLEEYEMLIPIRDILQSYLLYTKIIGKLYNTDNILTNSLLTLLEFHIINSNEIEFNYNNYSTDCNIYLNGLDLTVRDIYNELKEIMDDTIKIVFFITRITGNIYLRDNKLVGIPSEFILFNYQRDHKGQKNIIKRICSYKNFDITGNPIDFSLKTSDDIHLASIDFFKKTWMEIENYNPAFMTKIYELFDQKGIVIKTPTLQRAGTRCNIRRNNTLKKK